MERMFQEVGKTGVKCNLPCWNILNGLNGTNPKGCHIALTNKHIAHGINVPNFGELFAVCNAENAPKQANGTRRVCHLFNSSVWLRKISER